LTVARVSTATPDELETLRWQANRAINALELRVTVDLLARGEASPFTVNHAVLGAVVAREAVRSMVNPDPRRRAAIGKAYELVETRAEERTVQHVLSTARSLQAGSEADNAVHARLGVAPETEDGRRQRLASELLRDLSAELGSNPVSTADVVKWLRRVTDGRTKRGRTLTPQGALAYIILSSRGAELTATARKRVAEEFVHHRRPAD
jgi:hypothetical protein